MRLPILFIGLSLTACKGTLPPYQGTPDVPNEEQPEADTDAPTTTAQHDARFVGLWAVEQPFHAAYEITYYDFQADGTLVVGDSWPENCAGHLDSHCVTGSVADCVSEPDTMWCEAETTCVFGDSWRSEDDQTLVIQGHCSDDVTRDIVLEFNSDSSQNASFGAGATLLTVDGEVTWSHNSWEWAFRKCLDDDTQCGWMP
jgi:hypothetical protein